MDVVDVGRLIECIQERTFLWDNKNNHFRDFKARNMAWMEIGDEIFDNWSQLSRSEKAEKEKVMKNKWHNVKISFFKSLKGGYDNIYGDSLNFLRDRFQERKAPESLLRKLASTKYIRVRKEVPSDSRKVYENSSSDSFQNNNRLRNAQPRLPQVTRRKTRVRSKVQKYSHEVNENSSSDSFQNNNRLRNAKPSLPQETSYCPSSDSLQKANKPRNVQRSLTQGSSNSSSLESTENTNRLRNAQSTSSGETNKKAEADPEQEKSAEKLFLDSVLRDYREFSEDEKLDFRIMCLQHIRAARKKRNSQNHASSVGSSRQWHSGPEQITPD